MEVIGDNSKGVPQGPGAAFDILAVTQQPALADTGRNIQDPEGRRR